MTAMTFGEKAFVYMATAAALCLGAYRGLQQHLETSHSAFDFDTAVGLQGVAADGFKPEVFYLRTQNDEILKLTCHAAERVDPWRDNAIVLVNTADHLVITKKDRWSAPPRVYAGQVMLLNPLERLQPRAGARTRLYGTLEPVAQVPDDATDIQPLRPPQP